MLIGLLVFLGLAPQEAVQNPCFGPTWALSESVALACDFHDATGAFTILHEPRYIGRRTHAAFSAHPLSYGRGEAILVSDKAVSEADAQKAALEIGASGGWVDQAGVARGAGGSWSVDLSHVGVTAKPGTLVLLSGAAAK
ncbi:hypothetical protein BCO37747_07634 [Burkholderia contaminans]|jgi:hypothetical protein|uniref:Uncharacterized protein n=2 Tax=Burkholderia cepacia complex TaxID=87882 RepID=A0A250LKV8_9BURK|nr:hypothetical protein [Burkholderia contaminans]CAB3974956.1 hypothetical protein BLA3211_08273 [Burkholderia aenigmatica]MBA9906748.1 hypothetical protein [Burkholderia contaminans]PRG16478.1 hypothetical protein C6Q17_00255 [Burkholderia contaminans]VWD63217.1 hypothetical protein BCO37747_07634 [Burkholderia contaminans]